MICDENQSGAEIIHTVKKFISEHLSDDLSLDSAASAVNLNPKYLSKLFIDETGSSFIDYITMLRMEEAKKLLIHSELAVNEIVEKIGYISTSYFIRKFKETYGETPSNYRRYNKI